jgi:hypothetical protein
MRLPPEGFEFPFLCGQVISVTGFHTLGVRFRDDINATVTRFGGVYDSCFDPSKCTVLIAEEPSGDKYTTALSHSKTVLIVRFKWWQHALDTRSIPKPAKDLLWPSPPTPSPASARRSPRRIAQAPVATLSSSSSFLQNVHAIVLPDASFSSRWSSASRECVSLLRRHGARCATSAAAADDESITHIVILASPSELPSADVAAIVAILSSVPCLHARVVTLAWLHACIAAGMVVFADTDTYFSVWIRLFFCFE